jgi:hypothetical protein
LYEYIYQLLIFGGGTFYIESRGSSSYRPTSGSNTFLRGVPCTYCIIGSYTFLRGVPFTYCILGSNTSSGDVPSTNIRIILFPGMYHLPTLGSNTFLRGVPSTYCILGSNTSSGMYHLPTLGSYFSLECTIYQH